MRPKHAHRAGLPSAVLFFCVHGELPPYGHPARAEGLVPAFELKHSAALVADLRTLWAQHAEEILTATPPGGESWALRVLRAPDILADDDEAPDEEEEEA